MEPARRNDDHWPVPEQLYRVAQQRLLQLAAGGGQQGERAVRTRPAARTAVRELAQAGPGQFGRPERLGGLARGAVPDPSVPADQHVQGGPQADDLDQAGAIQLGQQCIGIQVVEPGRVGGARGAGGAHHPGADRVLQPPLLLAEGGDRAAPVLSLGQAADHVAGGGELGREFLVIAGPDRGHGQGGGPPVLAPAQQRPGPTRAQRLPLGQLGGGRAGLGAQLRGAQREPMCVQQVQAAAARVQQPARIGGRLGQQGPGQPAGRPGVGRAAEAAAGGGRQLTAGLIRPAEPQRDPPGQQVCLGCLDRAKPVELASQPASLAEERRGALALGEARAKHQEPSVSLPPIPVLSAEQAPGRPGAGQGHRWLLRRECGGRRSQPQFRLLGGLAADPLEIPDGLLRLAQRVAGQTRCEQHCAAVDVQVGQRYVQGRVTPGRLI